MRNLMLVCAGLALVGGIVSVNLWRELRGERVLTAQLRQQLLGLPTAAAAPDPVSSQMVAVPVPGAAAPVAPAASGRTEAAAAKEGELPTAQNTDVARLLLNQQEMMKDPEYRKARLAQTRMSLPQNFPGLVEELGLSPEEADRLFDLMAENQLEMSDVSMLAATINGVRPDPAVAEEANRRRQELQRRHDESLMAMLGGNRYSQWQDYQQTRGARQQVVQLTRTLEGVGLPLSPEQSRPLTAAYIAEQNRQREETQRMFSSSRQPGAADQERMTEERFKLQAESNRRIVDAARAHLSTQQLEALQASLDQQLAMNRASNRLMRQRMEAQGQIPAGAITVISAPPALPAF